MKYYCGVDIGSNGGIVVIDEDNNIVLKHIMPKVGNSSEIDVGKLIEYFTKFDLVIVAMEDLSSIFGASSRSNFTFGINNGIIIATVKCLKLPFIKIHSKTWQKFAFEGIREVRKAGNGKKDKNGNDKLGKVDTKLMALQAIHRLYPNEDFTKSERAKKAHDGLIDACLISRYLKHNYK